VHHKKRVSIREQVGFSGFKTEIVTLRFCAKILLTKQNLTLRTYREIAYKANLIASPKLTLKHQANQANQSSLKGKGLIECKSSKQKLGLIGLQFRSSLNQALVFSLIVDKSESHNRHVCSLRLGQRRSDQSLGNTPNIGASQHSIDPKSIHK
jgi:hypothetical protein